MIVKRLLFEWKEEISTDLKDVPFKQISSGTGINLQTIRNYITLTGQASFDPAVIELINNYRDQYLEKAKGLTRPKQEVQTFENILS